MSNWIDVKEKQFPEKAKNGNRIPFLAGWENEGEIEYFDYYTFLGVDQNKNMVFFNINSGNQNEFKENSDKPPPTHWKYVNVEINKSCKSHSEEEISDLFIRVLGCNSLGIRISKSNNIIADLSLMEFPYEFFSVEYIVDSSSTLSRKSSTIINTECTSFVECLNLVDSWLSEFCLDSLYETGIKLRNIL